MQALQAAPPGAPLQLEPPDPFWDGQNHADLDGFLCSLLAEGQVELTAQLVPPALAARWVLAHRQAGEAASRSPALSGALLAGVSACARLLTLVDHLPWADNTVASSPPPCSFGLSTDSNVSSQVMVPRATAAALRTSSAPTGRTPGMQALVHLSGAQAAQQAAKQQQAAAAGARRGQRTATPPSGTEQHPGQLAGGASLDPGAGTIKQQPSGAPLSISGLLVQQAAALAAGTEQQPQAAQGGGPSSNPFSSDPATHQAGEVENSPHLRYDFLQAQQDQAAVVAQFQQQQAQAQAAAMYAQQQAYQQSQQFAAQQAFQAQMDAQQQQATGTTAGQMPKPGEAGGEAGGGGAADAAASFFQRQQQAAAAAYGQFQNPWGGWGGGMYGGGYPGQFGGYPNQQFGGFYPPYQGPMQQMQQQMQQQMGPMPGMQVGACPASKGGWVRVLRLLESGMATVRTASK